MSTRLNIDPRTVPVAEVHHHLPPVPLSHLHPNALRERFAHALSWVPEIRREPAFSDRPPAPAAVLVGLITHDDDPARMSVLLTQRTAHLSTHSGQVAFPGGRIDPEDASPEAAALREAQEEVGLDPRHVQVIGRMPIYTTGSGFLITPVVALIEPGAALTPNPHEVADVFEVPLGFLMNPAHHRLHRWQNQEVAREWLSMPFDDLVPGPDGLTERRERYIWGATASMLRNLYRYLMLPLPDSGPAPS